MPKNESLSATTAWPVAVCARLRKLRVNRVNAKSRLADLIKERNSLQAEIRRMGKAPTPERLKLDHELVEALDAIEFQRARSLQLADRVEKTIDDADQGKFDFADDEPVDVDEATFWDAENDESDGDEAAKPDGRPVGGVAPKRSGKPAAEAKRFPGRYRLTAPARPDWAKPVDAENSEDLLNAIGSALNGAHFRFDEQAGTVEVNGKLCLRVEFMEPLPPAQAPGEAPEPAPAEKPAAAPADTKPEKKPRGKKRS